jgi:uncharacterized protein (TIGR03067 family)
MTKIKNVLAAALVLAGIAAGLMGKTQADDTKAVEELSDKTDQECIVGNWYIVNEDGKRQGEMWVISEDRILMYAKHGGANANLYFHRLNADKDPKQIDITVTKVNGSPSSPIGVIKGIYVLDEGELRLCLGDLGQDRPAAFPEKPGPGELLILHRRKGAAVPLQANEEQPAAKKDQQVLTPAEAIKQTDQEQVIVRLEVASVKMGWSTGAIPKGSKTTWVWWALNDGSNFTVVLKGRAAYQLERLRIDTINHFKGRAIQVTGRVQGKEPSFHMVVDDLDQLEIVQ